MREKSFLPIIDDFPERLRRIRKECRWTQKEMSDNLKISRPYLALLESGKRTPSMKILEKIIKKCAIRVGRPASHKIWYGPMNGDEPCLSERR